MTAELPIIPVGVADAPFTLDLVAHGCPPTQFVREFTINGIEAIEAYRERVDASYEGEVIWTVDSEWERVGVCKLMCVDTGIGMGAAEMPTYLNDLASSGKRQGLAHNYGFGAKVSAAVGNGRGVIYRTWRAGERDGSLAELGRDRAGIWGLRQHRDPHTGDVMAIVPIEPDARPQELAQLDHGTAVTFLGVSDEHDTTLAPKGERGERWIAKTLNQRVYQLPDWVTIKVREIKVEGERRHERFRFVRGQRYYLDRHTIAQGTHPIKGALVHWRILDEDHEERSKQANIWASVGHRACLHRGELFELATAARGGYEKLKEFGIRFGYERVVLYAEPLVSDHALVTQDAVRTQVKIAGEPLPWDLWAAEFDATMPAELRAFQEEIAAGATHRDHSASVRERLADIADLFKIPRYKRARAGAHEIDEPNVGGQAAREQEPEPIAEREGHLPPGGGTAGNVYSLFKQAGGQPADEVTTETLPEIEVDWVSVSDHTRAPGDMEDRAAQYDRKRNYMQINADFRGYADVLARWGKRYKGVAGAQALIDEIAASWWQQALEETILGILALRGSEHWDERSVSTALSEEALTASAMQRYHLDAILKRELGNRLGAVRQAA
jgi:hypothetical protein